MPLSKTKTWQQHRVYGTFLSPFFSHRWNKNTYLFSPPSSILHHSVEKYHITWKEGFRWWCHMVTSLQRRVFNTAPHFYFNVFLIFIQICWVKIVCGINSGIVEKQHHEMILLEKHFMFNIVYRQDMKSKLFFCVFFCLFTYANIFLKSFTYSFWPQHVHLWATGPLFSMWEGSCVLSQMAGKQWNANF